MPHFALSVDIERHQADVFGFVAEGANSPQWKKMAVDDRWLGDGPMRPGRRARVVRKSGGISFVLVVEIVEWDPPRYVSYRIVEGKLVGLDESYLFEPLGDGTRLTITVDSPPYPNNAVGRLWNPLFKRLMVRQVRADFETLKRRLES